MDIMAEYLEKVGVHRESTIRELLIRLITSKDRCPAKKVVDHFAGLIDEMGKKALAIPDDNYTKLWLIAAAQIEAGHLREVIRIIGADLQDLENLLNGNLEAFKEMLNRGFVIGDGKETIKIVKALKEAHVRVYHGHERETKKVIVAFRRPVKVERQRRLSKKTTFRLRLD